MHVHIPSGINDISSSTDHEHDRA